MSAVFDPRTGAQVAASKRKRITASFTRPADTTAYAAGDAVNNSTSAPTVMTFADVVRNAGGTGKIVEVSVETNNATVTNGTFRFYVHNASFTPTVDNTAYATLHTNRASLQGYVDLPILTADSASAAAASSRVTSAGVGGGDDGVPIYFECAAGDDSLYGVLVATGAYTPASGQVVQVSIVVEQD